MNVKRFTARTSRDALTLVRQAFGDDAVVLSTRPSPEGVEVLAMAPESVQQIEQLSAATARSLSEAAAQSLPPQNQAPQRPGAGAPSASRNAAAPATSIDEDVQQLSMSTLSFQDYVRERMLKRRAAQLGQAASPAVPHTSPQPDARSLAGATREPEPLREPVRVEPSLAGAAAGPAPRQAAAAAHPIPVLADALPARGGTAAQHRHDQDMLDELRQVKGLIEARFGALAFMERLQRQPAQARLTQQLLEAGFSPALIRKLADGLPPEAPDESAWAAVVLERNLPSHDAEPALEDRGGVFALIGSTGVGKTTTTAKIAAAFATRHGAGALGLITLDAYRVAAHEQLRAYGRILGVPVHTAHDRASLDDLLELLAGKKMVLIDTAGIAQRDTRTRELLEMLSHRSIEKLLVVNAASQGETIEDVLINWRASAAAGVVLSKIDEAVKLGPALDALIRHRLKVVGIANGQRVPEDWHRLSSHALVQRALRTPPNPAWRFDASDVSLVFAGAPVAAAAGARGALHA